VVGGHVDPDRARVELGERYMPLISRELAHTASELLQDD